MAVAFGPVGFASEPWLAGGLAVGTPVFDGRCAIFFADLKAFKIDSKFIINSFLYFFKDIFKNEDNLNKKISYCFFLLSNL